MRGDGDAVRCAERADSGDAAGRSRHARHARFSSARANLGVSGAVQDLPFGLLVACAPSGSLARWPTGKQGWTVVLATRSSERAARDVATRFAAEGVPDVGVLDSDDFGSLNGGLWVVYSGEFATQAEATQALDELDLPDVYIRRIAAN